MSAAPPAAAAYSARVYYEDTDAGGVMHNAAYLRFFERARGEWLRQRGFSQRSLATEENALFAVRRASVEYLRPAFLDDLLHVYAVVWRLGRASAVFAQWLSREGEDEPLATAAVLAVCVSARPLRARPLPPNLRAALAAPCAPPPFCVESRHGF